MTHSNRLISIEPYRAEMAAEWDAVVEQSANGTFLLQRSFMDYHQERFADCSLIVRKGAKAVACFPANFVEQAQSVVSHQGLTYGGLIVLPQLSSAETIEAYSLIADYYAQELKARQLVVKPVPTIYHRYPADAQLYALFRMGATLTARGLSSTLLPPQHLPYKRDRRTNIHKAEAAGLTIRATNCERDIINFWEILQQRLASRHNVQPVHTAAEIELLMERFPKQISLHLCELPDESLPAAQRIMAGAWMFDCGPVAHTQYLATTTVGQHIGALDVLIAHLIDNVFAKHPYFDFGISTEADGTILNTGLLLQKEGFGARGTCYDTWRIPLV